MHDDLPAATEQPITPPTSAEPKRKRHRIRGRDRDYFTSNLALLLKASVPVGEAINSLRETAHAGGLKKTLEQMERDINEGLPLHTTLRLSGLASSQTLTLVEFGEKSGYLVENLQAAAKQEEKQRALRSKIRGALFYPVFVLGLTFVIGLGIAWFLLPRLAETFTKLDLQLPLITQIFIAFGQFLRVNGAWFVPLLLVVFFALIYIFFFARRTKFIGQALLFRTPGIKQLMREVELARMGYLLGTLLQAGLTITQSFQLVRDATENRSYQKLYLHLYRSFDEGYSLKTSLANYKNAQRLVPQPVQQIMITGEKTGSLADSLLNIGEIYEEKTETTTKNLETMLEPILLVIIAGGVLAVAVGVILPLYSLVGGLDQ